VRHDVEPASAFDPCDEVPGEASAAPPFELPSAEGVSVCPPQATNVKRTRSEAVRERFMMCRQEQPSCLEIQRGFFRPEAGARAGVCQARDPSVAPTP
jgi:hypothetical protein